jgi:hypothetical protein
MGEGDDNLIKLDEFNFQRNYTPWQDISILFNSEEAFGGQRAVHTAAFMTGLGNPGLSFFKYILPDVLPNLPLSMRLHIHSKELLNVAGAKIIDSPTGIEMSRLYFGGFFEDYLVTQFPDLYHYTDILDKWGHEIATRISPQDIYESAFVDAFRLTVDPVIGSYLLNIGIQNKEKWWGKLMAGAGMFKLMTPLTSLLVLEPEYTDLFQVFDKLIPGFDPTSIEVWLGALAFTLGTYIGIPKLANKIKEEISYLRSSTTPLNY